MKISDEEKLSMMNDVLRKKMRCSVVARKYGVSSTYVRVLASRAKVHGAKMVLHNYSRGSYPQEFKLKVVKSIEAGETIKAASIEFNLDCSVVLKWWTKYSEGGIEGLFKNRRTQPLKEDRLEDSNQKEKKTHTEKEFEELQKQLRRAQMENEFLKKLDALVRERIERENGK